MENYVKNFTETELVSNSKFNFLKENSNLMNSAKTKIHGGIVKPILDLYYNQLYKTNITQIYINKYENISFNITDNNIVNTEWPSVVGTNIINIKQYSNPQDIELLPVTFIWSHSWQHFMQDNLPILCYILPFLKKNPQITLLFRNTNFDLNYILSLLNIPNKTLFSNNTNFTCKKLYHIHFSPNATVYWWPPILFQNCNNIISNPESIQNKLIYITRNNVRTRRISNENEVVSFLKQKANELNLEFIYFQHNNFTTQQRRTLFNEAKFVLAPHGGANYHILFCKPKTLFIEICFIDLMHCLANIALSIGLNYWILPVRGNQNSPSCQVNIENLKNILLKN